MGYAAKLGGASNSIPDVTLQNQGTFSASGARGINLYWFFSGSPLIKIYKLARFRFGNGGNATVNNQYSYITWTSGSTSLLQSMLNVWNTFSDINNIRAYLYSTSANVTCTGYFYIDLSN